MYREILQMFKKSKKTTLFSQFNSKMINNKGICFTHINEEDCNCRSTEYLGRVIGIAEFFENLRNSQVKTGYEIIEKGKDITYVLDPNVRKLAKFFEEKLRSFCCK
ncbi:hypothetical protein CWI38_0004p0040 [Hamiltosporidium tvaerminnensis]|uniref:Uncharacterized protein n=2 Tax=Hamiltosporidium TaxID=1176354 RepID=A0A4V2JVN1_9MICR|nr:hypothetical protein CWI37_0098p0020 [Hamiltosporidium tvaerminnensis]TBU08630.1 hypothetical protein CWI36_0114p0060 [Hamiltosporidium magnivora]TBU20971.1 hypothetical protein CWI38_0006p0090 [Hamiltosporidium tvaerminnensis]TBU20997.1 hypothetical protein CWI38_0004p0040 [Hamiltosporidium tvaerminnensis]